MDIENTFTKPILLFHFGKGKNEIETHEEIVKQYGKYAICLKTINKWFAEFKKGKHGSAQGKPDDSKKKVSDEDIIKLVDDNPQLTMEELGKLAGVNKDTISRRLKQINSEGEIVSYVYKNYKRITSKENGILRLTDDFIISLVNKNPGLCMRELALLAGISQSTLSKRLKVINNGEEKAIYVNKKSRKRYSETDAKLGLIPKPIPKPFVKFTDEYLIGKINENPKLNMRELAEIIGISTSTISRRIRQINTNEGKAIYAKKNFLRDKHKANSKPKPILTDQNLIEMVNDNPSLDLKELAALAGISCRCLTKRIKQINWINARINYSNDRSKKCKKSRS